MNNQWILLCKVCFLFWLGIQNRHQCKL